MEERDFSHEELVEAEAVEGGFADIIGGLQSRLGTMERNVVTGDLAAADAAGGVFTWRNTLGYDVVVVRAFVQVKTVATGTCTISVGQASTVAVANNLLTALDVNAATGVFDNITDKGASGKSRILVPAGNYVTGSMVTGATAGLVGRYALHLAVLG